MPRFIIAVATATLLLTGSLVSKAEAAMVNGIESLPLANSHSPVEKVRRCVCGPNGCVCGRRYWRGYRYGYYGYGYRPYPYYGYGYRWRY